MSEEQVEHQEEQVEPSFADLLYAIVSDAIEREGTKQVYKELVMITKEVEVLVEMHLADTYEGTRKSDTLDNEEESDVESSYAEEAYSEEDSLESNFNEEKEIIESLKDKIKRWFK